MKKFSLNLTDQQKLFLTSLLPKGYSLTQTRLTSTETPSTGPKRKFKQQSHTSKEGDESSKSSNSHQSAPQNKAKASNPTTESKITPLTQKTLIKSEKTQSQNVAIKKYEKVKFFNLLLDQIQKKKSASIFIEPVDPIKLGIPNYFDVIKYPMAIQTMRSKVKQGKYVNFFQFEKDLQKISSNCVKFNAGNNFFVQMAKKFQMEFKKIIQRYNDKIDSLFTEIQSKNDQSNKSFEQNSEQQTNSQAQITGKNKAKKKSQKLKRIQTNNLSKQETRQKDKDQDKKADSQFLKPKDINQKEKGIQEQVCLKSQKAKEAQRKLDNRIQTQTNGNQNKIVEKRKQEKDKNLQKTKEKKIIRIKKYSYQDRLGIISRIKKLDRGTMSQFFEEIKFSKGESLDFKVLEDEKIKEMENKLKKYEIIHQQKLKKIEELNRGKSRSQDFEIEEDKDYED